MKFVMEFDVKYIFHTINDEQEIAHNWQCMGAMDETLSIGYSYMKAKLQA